TSLARYDTFGELWMAAWTGPLGNPYNGVPVQYLRQGAGHTYDSSDPTESVVVAPDQSNIGFEGSNVYTLPVDANQLDNAMYMMGTTSLQRALFAYITWIKDTSYKLTTGYTVLPAEAHVCISDASKFCDAAHPCPSGSCSSSEAPV